MSARVTHVEIESDSDGLRAAVTVNRIPDFFMQPAPPPVEDLPADIRDALLEWAAR